MVIVLVILWMYRGSNFDISSMPYYFLLDLTSKCLRTTSNCAQGTDCIVWDGMGSVSRKAITLTLYCLCHICVISEVVYFSTLNLISIVHFETLMACRFFWTLCSFSPLVTCTSYAFQVYEESAAGCSETFYSLNSLFFRRRGT